MATAPTPDGDIVDRFMESRGLKSASWVEGRNRKQCPECGAVNVLDAEKCTSCGWEP